jgi:hypothetical protein
MVALGGLKPGQCFADAAGGQTFFAIKAVAKNEDCLAIALTPAPGIISDIDANSSVLEIADAEIRFDLGTARIFAGRHGANAAGVWLPGALILASDEYMLLAKRAPPASPIHAIKLKDGKAHAVPDNAPLTVVLIWRVVHTVEGDVQQVCSVNVMGQARA